MMNASYILPSPFVSQSTLLDFEKYVQREDRTIKASLLNTQLPLTSKAMLDNIDRTDRITELLSIFSYELEGKLVCVPCQREFKVRSQKEIRIAHQLLNDYKAAHVRQSEKSKNRLSSSDNRPTDLDYGAIMSKLRSKERQVTSLTEAEAKCDAEIKQLLQDLIDNGSKDGFQASSLTEQEFLLQAQDEELALEADRLKAIMSEVDIINKHLPRQSLVSSNEPQRLSLLPLFDSLEVDREGRWAMINGLRLRFSAAPALHLNWREINHAWSASARFLSCLRHTAGLSEVIYLAPVASAPAATNTATTTADGISKRSQSVASLRIIPLADRALLTLKYPSGEEVKEEQLYLEGGVTAQPLVYNRAVLAFATAVAITALELGQQQLRKQRQQSSAPGASGGLAAFLTLCGLDRSLLLAELALAAVQGRPLGFDSDVSTVSNKVEADEVSRQLLSSLVTDSNAIDSSKLLQGLQTCRLLCDRLRCATVISFRMMTVTKDKARAEIEAIAHSLVIDTLRLLQQLTV